MKMSPLGRGKCMLFSLICLLFLRKDKYCCYAFELALICANFIVKQTGFILICYCNLGIFSGNVTNGKGKSLLLSFFVLFFSWEMNSFDEARSLCVVLLVN